MKRSGIIRCYYEFIEELHKDKTKLAYLQLCGKIEEYLVKDLMFYIFKDSQGKCIVLQNVGEKKEQKIDLVVLKGDINQRKGKGLHIESAIEAKYIRNCHRFYIEFPATDEISTSLKQLAEQTGKLEKVTHGDYTVKLNSKTKEIYGLVFASFVSDKKNSADKEEFYNKKILESKYAKCFKYHDLQKPYFREVYNDVLVEALGKKFFVTLRMGLWKKKD